ncbi:MAG: hypothetical protein ACD_3C00215G0001 [uncultured bacterium (gcode 4)]|uniref:Uncharacterized protein n=1 Tax=uncultured bacterium (gcode 4) TaxID=1234023 RepID=K2FWL4_9BACT|nr:MAG: hypothetical protein ACD_3C00215G0001 [uncultured bacterium (gcode 4)]
MIQSAVEIFESEMARTFHFLALISCMEERFFSNRKFFGANMTHGKLSSINAREPCFSSQVGRAWELRYDISLNLRLASYAIGSSRCLHKKKNCLYSVSSFAITLIPSEVRMTSSIAFGRFLSSLIICLYFWWLSHFLFQK